jgi:hypothetical protein
MTRPSRGVSDIQEKARGNDMKGMKKDIRKAMGPKPEKSAVKIKAKAPSIAGEGPMGMPAGRPGSFGGMGSLGAGPAPMGMKCGGSVKGYAKGGSIDGIASKGKTKGKIC